MPWSGERILQGVNGNDTPKSNDSDDQLFGKDSRNVLQGNSGNDEQEHKPKSSWQR